MAHARWRPFALIGLAAALAFWPMQAAAQDVETRAILTIVVNGTGFGESVVIIRDGRDGRDVFVPAGLLSNARIRPLPPAVSIDGISFISLRALLAGGTFVIDDPSLELRITAPAALFATNTIHLRAFEPDGTEHTRNASLSANYAINWTSGSAMPAATAELALSAGAVRFTTTVSKFVTGQVARGLTTVTLDQRVAMRRVQAGDVSVRGISLWSGNLIAGMSLAREFSLAPYFVRFPSPTLSQTLTTPSTVDVYVNGRLVRRAELPPGVFDITGLPALNGAGDTRLVIRDAFGRTEELSTTYYVTTSVLAKGLQDYQYAAGLRRTGPFESASPRPAFTATHRLGVNDRLTIGYHAEGDRALASGGLSVTGQPGKWGALEFAIGSSLSTVGGRGAAASAAWSYRSRTLSAAVGARWVSTSFVSLGESRVQAAGRLDVSATVSRSVRRIGDLGIDFRRQDLASSTGVIETRRRLAATGSRRIFAGQQLQWRIGRAWGRGAAGFDASLTVSTALGARAAAMVSASRQPGSSASDISMNRPLGAGPGVGIRARTDLAGETIDVAMQAQSRVGRVEVQATRLGGVSTSSATIAGGVATLGRTIKLTNTLGESFGLVRVPGVKNVRVFSNNVEVGRTDRRGDLLIPSLIPNYANRLAISDMDLPGDRAVADAEKLIAPPIAGGAVVTFGADRIRAMAGTLAIRTASGEIAPAYGLLSLRIGARVVESPVAADGAFFLEPVPAGEHSATLQYRDELYVVRISMPADAASVVNAGRLIAVKAIRN